MKIRTGQLAIVMPENFLQIIEEFNHLERKQKGVAIAAPLFNAYD